MVSDEEIIDGKKKVRPSALVTAAIRALKVGESYDGTVPPAYLGFNPLKGTASRVANQEGRTFKYLRTGPETARVTRLS